MAYLGLNIDSLVWEIKSIMENNFGSNITEDNFNDRFEQTKETIIENFISAIEDNRSVVFEELNESGNIIKN